MENVPILDVSTTLEKVAGNSDNLFTKIIKFNIAGFSTGDFIQVVLAIVVVKLLLVYFVENVAKHLYKTKIDRGIAGFLISVLKGIIYTLGLVVILGALGLPIAKMAAVIGVLGLAISLSIQNFMANVMSGLTILIAKPYVIGDYVEIGQSSGTVKFIGLLYTELLSVDLKVHLVPNSIMASHALINHSRNVSRKIDTYISIDYSDDVDLAMNIIKSILDEDKRIYKDKPITVALRRFATSSIDILVRAETSSVEYFDVIDDFNYNLYKAFGDNNISFAYPHMQVLLKGDK